MQEVGLQEALTLDHRLARARAEHDLGGGDGDHLRGDGDARGRHLHLVAVDIRQRDALGVETGAVAVDVVDLDPLAVHAGAVSVGVLDRQGRGVGVHDDLAAGGVGEGDRPVGVDVDDRTLGVFEMKALRAAGVVEGHQMPGRGLEPADVRGAELGVAAVAGGAGRGPERSGPERVGDEALLELHPHRRSDLGKREQPDVGRAGERQHRQRPVRRGVSEHRRNRDLKPTQLQRVRVVHDEPAVLPVVAALRVASELCDHVSQRALRSPVPLPPAAPRRRPTLPGRHPPRCAAARTSAGSRHR